MRLIRPVVFQVFSQRESLAQCYCQARIDLTRAAWVHRRPFYYYNNFEDLRKKNEKK